MNKTNKANEVRDVAINWLEAVEHFHSAEVLNVANINNPKERERHILFIKVVKFILNAIYRYDYCYPKVNEYNVITCSNCGKEIHSNDVYCSNCGLEIIEEDGI